MKKQAGLTAVEFSIVALVFFMLLFGVIEAGRTMFTMALLDEVTRASARLAAVCAPGDAGIRQNAFPVMLPEMGPDNIAITYFDGNMNAVVPNAATFPNIRFVRAQIVNYQFDLLVPGLDLTVTAPDFQTTIPSESLGARPVATMGVVGC